MEFINISFNKRNQLIQIPILQDEGKAFIIGVRMALNNNILLSKEQINICIKLFQITYLLCELCYCIIFFRFHYPHIFK